MERTVGTPDFPSMCTVNNEDYLKIMNSGRTVLIGNTPIKLRKWTVGQTHPSQWAPEEWTVWSFPERGSWATHVGDYPGNWSPFVPRNLIAKYTNPGDSVCDPMMGSGTTLVECKLMGRNAVGVDVNPDAVIVAMNRLAFVTSEESSKTTVYVGDARNLNLIGDCMIDLIATHPPYWRIVSYSCSKITGDLSSLELEDYLTAIEKIAKEFLRVLRPNRHCCVLIGDTRIRQHYVPISAMLLDRFLQAGFVLKEEIIKLQHKTKSSASWSSEPHGFYKIAHEHLYVFRKPDKNENVSPFKYSTKWW